MDAKRTNRSATAAAPREPFDRLVARNWRDSADARAHFAEQIAELVFRARRRLRRLGRQLATPRHLPLRAMAVIACCSLVSAAALAVAGIWLALGARLGGMEVVSPAVAAIALACLGGLAGGAVAGANERNRR